MANYEETSVLGIGLSVSAVMETFWKVVVKGTVKRLHTVLASVKRLYEARPTKRSGF